MVPVTSLWIPILLSAVLVFIVSSILHMLLPWHRGDMKKLPSEDEVLEALRKASVPPGDYMAPYAGSMKAMSDPAFLERRTKGPVVLMTVVKGGPPTMGPSLLLWFLYSALISVFAAYVTGRALGPGAQYLAVFRFAGTAAFMGYSLALLQNSIWYKRNWGSTIKSVIDGLVYGMVTAGAFGWLWPR
jgi:hypothetical protein